MNSYNTGYKTQVVLQFKNSSKTSIVKRLVIQILILQKNTNTCSSKEFNMVFTSSLKFGNFRLDIIIKKTSLVCKTIISDIYVKIVHVAVSD